MALVCAMLRGKASFQVSDFHLSLLDNFLWIQSFLSEIPFLLRSANKLWRIFFIAFSAVENIQDDMQVSHGANGEEKQSFLSPAFQETPQNMQEEPWSGIEQ